MINQILLKIKTEIGIIPKQYIYIYIILFWLVLIILGHITINRLINFIIILLIIAIFQILHKYIWKMYSYVYNKKTLNEKDISKLLKIYKYKNPIILFIIWIEEKFFKFIYSYTKKFNIIYINIIYHFLYNFTGLNGIKIVLYKFYKILIDWKQFSIYEILFKRIYGMIISVLILTNIIQIVLSILNSISPNSILWIYMLLVLISYASNYLGYTKNIIDIENARIECNLIGTILQKETNGLTNLDINKKQLNIDIKMYLWFLYINKNWLNFDNFLKCRAFQNSKWMEFNNKPSFFYFNNLISENFWINYNYILTKHNKLLKKNIDNTILNYCEYHILLYKLRVFYVWDVEKWFNIKDSYFKLTKENMHDTFFDIDITLYTYEYDKIFLKIFKAKLNNIKRDKFWDLQENYNFYKKMYDYIYDNDFQESYVYKKNTEYYNSDELGEDAWSDTNEYRDIKIEKQEEYLQKEFNNWRLEWQQNSDKELIYKYNKIFVEIDNYKNKLKCIV